MFEGAQASYSGNQNKSSHYNPTNESRLWRRLEAEKMIQYEEMASKGSERPASMFGPSALNGERGGTAQGSTSVVMSGTPTDYNKLYNADVMSNQQTFYQINYIGGSAQRQGGAIANLGGKNTFDKSQPYSLNKYRGQRNRGNSIQRNQPSHIVNNFGGLSSLSNNMGSHHYPNSAGGFYHENTLYSALQKSHSKNSLVNVI